MGENITLSQHRLVKFTEFRVDGLAKRLAKLNLKNAFTPRDQNPPAFISSLAYSLVLADLKGGCTFRTT